MHSYNSTKIKIPSPIGWLAAEVGEGYIYRLDLDNTADLPDTTDDETAVRLIRELDEYFRGERTSFSLEAKPSGTPFQQAVWEEMRKIPYGETRTYGEIAEAIGRPGSSRAVGHACHVNHILILIPCHRVVSASGIGGFAPGLDAKKILLDIENTER